MLIPWLCLARLLQLSLFIHSVPQSLSHPFIHPISVGRAPTRTSKGLVSADLFPSRSAPQLSVPVLRPRRLTAGALLPSAFRLETLAGNLKRKQLGNSACSASPPRWSVVGGPSSFQQLSSLWTQPRLLPLPLEAGMMLPGGLTTPCGFSSPWTWSLWSIPSSSTLLSPLLTGTLKKADKASPLYSGNQLQEHKSHGYPEENKVMG